MGERERERERDSSPFAAPMYTLQSHDVPEETQLGCPLDDLGQLCEYAN